MAFPFHSITSPVDMVSQMPFPDTNELEKAEQEAEAAKKRPSVASSRPSWLTGLQSPTGTSADKANPLEHLDFSDRMSSSPGPGGFARKASVGFNALLGKVGGTMRKPGQGLSRRGTAASTVSMDGSIIDSVTGEVIGSKLSLQDQFANLRRQEEFTTVGVNDDETEADEDKSSTAASSTHGVNGHVRGTQSPPKDTARKRTSSNASVLRSQSINPSLPPGTASGIAAGPAKEFTEVNWDLWQQVVYEGPAAVARTSGDELKDAIASGIPAAIRGVVWQVLAESKNEELEHIYRTLKNRRPDDDVVQPPVFAPVTFTDVNGPNSEHSSTHRKESRASDAKDQIKEEDEEDEDRIGMEDKESSTEAKEDTESKEAVDDKDVSEDNESTGSKASTEVFADSSEKQPTGDSKESIDSKDSEAVKSDTSSERSSHSAAAAEPNPGILRVSTEASHRSTPPVLLAEKHKHDAVALAKLEKAIKRDLGSRTSFSKYTQSAGLQDGLFGLCKAYALFDEGVGYAQGINFIAMPLLFNMGEDEAFTLLVTLMGKYDVRSMFTPDMAGLHLRLYLFERLLEDQDPVVFYHLRKRNVSPQLYATPWFLTLFAHRFPLQLVLRVYDLIFSEGLTAILKFGLVLMQRNREALLEMKDMSQLSTFLKERLFDVYIDKSPSSSSLLESGFFGSVIGGADKELYRADEMVRDACKIQISDEDLAYYTTKWEEQHRLERDRENEIDNLRTTTAALTVQVRNLEERVLQQDTEHVNVAQDLVKVKVENDALQDANEGLKVQVAELQKLVDVQAAEVEARLKDEMDRIMQRNSEVQNENRGLKEEMDEMERELVNAKMAHAQMQADHDTLKKKWSGVQALLSENPAS